MEPYNLGRGWIGFNYPRAAWEKEMASSREQGGSTAQGGRIERNLSVMNWGKYHHG